MNCGAVYAKRPNISLDKWLKTSKYCSRNCMQNVNPGGRAVKGKPSWNSGTKGVCKPNSGSFKKGERVSPKTEFKVGQTANEENVNWKGGGAGYIAIHSWVKRRRPPTSICEFCGYSGFTVMANLDYEYTRDLQSWAELCASCHVYYDRQNGWGIATEKWGLHQ